MNPLELVRRARGALNRRAGGVGHWDCGRANSGRRCVNENALAHVKAGPREERVMCSNENFRHRARLHPIKVRRNASEITLRHDHKLRLRATGSDSKNAIAHFPGANRVTNRFDFACKLHARDVLRITRRRGIMSETLQNIGAVQSRCVDTDANAISHRRRWRVDLHYTDSVDLTVKCDDDRTHQSGYSSRAWIQTND